MNNFSIQAQDIGKMYRIRAVQDSYKTLRDTLVEGAVAPFRRVINLIRGIGTGAADLTEEFWALRDVNIEVKEGEVLGIIGRNGAGKSTLLKILSKITEPTTGKARLKGRVSSLLEVGTGFHPELTGRENVYLNGAILGMRKAEINRSFDAIVDFAEVAKFIDTPVKHYSSGMQLRLAFSVAAHLEPEILLVDEVLAVGDAAFQKKCIAQMENVGKTGRTVLFVSHNMPAVSRLCERIILLDQGKVALDGGPDEVVAAYLSNGMGSASTKTWPEAKRPGDSIAKLKAVRILAGDGTKNANFDIRDSITLEMEYAVLEAGHSLVPSFGIINQEGVWVCALADRYSPWYKKPLPKGSYSSRVVIPGNLLAEGSFFVTVILATDQPVKPINHFLERDALSFQVYDPLEGNSVRGSYTGKFTGVFRPMLDWETNPLE